MAKNVLIVDDQEFIRTILKTKLEGVEGVTTSEAANGDEAMMQALTFKPDLIFLDIVMPKIDGLTILQDLKKTPETKDVPIVIITSHAGEWQRQKAEELGVNEFIDKAILETVDFKALVQKHIQL